MDSPVPGGGGSTLSMNYSEPENNSVSSVTSMNNSVEYKPEVIAIAEKIVDQLTTVIGKGYMDKLNKTALRLTVNTLIKRLRDEDDNITYNTYFHKYIDTDEEDDVNDMLQFIKAKKQTNQYNNLITALANNLHVLYITSYINNINNELNPSNIHSNPLIFYLTIEYIELLGDTITFKEGIKRTQPLIDYILENNIVDTILESKKKY